jgi:hypothetical protein
VFIKKRLRDIRPFILTYVDDSISRMYGERNDVCRSYFIDVYAYGIDMNCGFILFFGKPPMSSVCPCKWNMYCSICLCAHTSHDAFSLNMLVVVAFLRIFAGQQAVKQNCIAPVET